jgi:hypothetical protein
MSEPQHSYVDPDPIRLPEAHHTLRLVVAIALIAAIIFIVGGFWYTLGFTWAFSIFCACVAISGSIILVLQISHRKWTQGFLAEAVARGHSVELKTPSEHLRTISPWTIPDTVRINNTAGGAEQIALPMALPTAPPFSQIAEQVSPGHLFLGQAATGPVWGDVTDLLSTIIAGRPGTGKSTKLRSVCGQLLLIGGHPILFDLHGSILDDLGSSFECAENPADMAEYAHWLDSTLDTRLVERRAGKRDFKPLLLLADEMPLIKATVPDAVEVIKRLVSEGRKVGMFVLIAGVGVPADILGGSLVRDACASRYVFNTTTQIARMAGIDAETSKPLLKHLELAGPGRAILATSNRSPEIIAVPYTSIADIRKLVSPATSSAASSAASTDEVIEADMKPGVKPAEPAFDARSRRIRDMVKAGISSRQIIQEIWGVQSGAGYTKAAQELATILATLV